MGSSSSKMEDDKALYLCRERKKFVRQALNGRCSLAAAHVSYVESLRNTGTALRKFTEPEAPYIASERGADRHVAFSEEMKDGIPLLFPGLAHSPSRQPMLRMHMPMLKLMHMQMLYEECLKKIW